MSAYNWVVVTHRCPNCSKQVDIRCQTHIASSYQGITKRFHNEINLLPGRENAMVAYRPS